MEPTRDTYLFFNAPLKALFFFLVTVSLVMAFWFLKSRYALWLQGKPLDWDIRKTIWARVSYMWDQVFGQRKVGQSRKRYGAPMHLFLFYGFVALTIGTTLLAIDEYGPVKFHKGVYFLIYEVVLDLAGAAVVVGAGMALLRRYVRRPASVSNSTFDAPLLLLILLTALTGFVLEGARFRIPEADTRWASWSPIGYLFSSAMPSLSPGAYLAIWWAHAFLVFGLFISLAVGRTRHLFFIPLVALGRPPRHMGELAAISIEEVERTGKIGAVEVGDYSRWHLMSADACMECGRCTDVCPAHAVGKVLDPKQIVQNLRGLMESSGRSVPEALNPTALMECTTCHACVRECPALIRHVDIIVDARRAMVAEGQVSGSLAMMMRQLGSTENPWGLPASEREAWMQGLDVPLVRDSGEFDVLLWVGCAGAFDKSAQATTRALAQLLNRAGVKYACLGNEERCTGDPARRAGDEFLFQQMAQMNVEVLNGYGVRKIVTPCPHCLNTFRNEYRQFDGRYEVVHHTELLAELIAAGKLSSAEPASKVVYHDPCYLARVNDVTDAPRSLSNRNLVSPRDHGKKTFCCGAGGARMWMEEAPDQRPGVKRARDLLATGATSIAVGCPFCKIMLGDSIPLATDKDVALVDMAELMIPNNTDTRV